MSEELDLNGREVTADDAFQKVIAAQAKVHELQREVAALRKDRGDLLSEYTDMRKARPVPKAPAPSGKRGKADIVRVSFGDVHGMRMDKAAIAALLADLKVIRPDEIVLGGDIVECGGWLAKHQPIGFIAQTDYTYQEDIAAANWLLDELQGICGDIHYIEGNHEDKVERWIVDVTAAQGRDAEFLRRFVSPYALLRLEERGIPYYRRTECYHDGLPLGWIKLGKMYYVHSLKYSKNAARDAAVATAGNVTYFCTHRQDQASVVFPSVGLVRAFNPGCLCHDDKTEILTDRGFVPFPELLDSDRVAEYDPDTECILHRLPVARQALRYKGDLYHFRSPRVDQKVTPEHRMLLIKDKHTYVRSAEQVSAMQGSSVAVPLAGYFVGENTGMTADQARLIGWIIAEGSLDTASYGYRITIYQKKQPHVNHIRALLARLRLKNKAKTDQRTGVVGFRICAKDSRMIVSELFDGDIKRIPRKCLSSGQEVQRALFDALMAGDGTRTKMGTGVYATSSIYLANDFQELAHKIGYACRIKTEQRSTNYSASCTIHLCRLRKYRCGTLFDAKNAGTVDKIPYDGIVYDVTTTTGFFMVRRNGNVSVSGNCVMLPIWKNSDISSWSQGYQIEFIAKSGNFQCVHVPIWRGESLAGAMIERFKT